MSLLLGGSKKAWDKQFVWPREGQKGRRPRGFMSGFIDILTNKGPDIYITPKGDRTPIPVDQWGNWDSYHSRDRQGQERLFSYNGVWNADRGNKRYDPYLRKYVEWEWDENWEQDPFKMAPRYHRDEHEYIARRNKVPKTKNFSHGRPKVS